MHDLPSDNPSISLFRHARHGAPSHVWIYRSQHNVPRGAVARYDLPAGKQIVPWVFDGMAYRARGFDKPRMLYGLERLARYPDARVLLVEGEKTADAAQHYFAKRPCMTWPGGVAGQAHADWAPLAGREVTIWPDNDEAGIEAASKIAGRLMGLGCAVWMVDPTDWPAKWDIADHDGDRAALVEYAKAHTVKIEPPSQKNDALLRETDESSRESGQTYQEAAPSRSKIQIWQDYGLVCKGTGRPYANAFNVALCIERISDLDVFYDTFAKRVMMRGREFGQEMSSQFHYYLQGEMGLSDLCKQAVEDGVLAYAYQHQRNPPKEWLESLQWDGTYRLREFITSGFGNAQSAYTAAVGTNFITGMVARIMQPGCKADCMVIFEGEQGAGKSRALAIVGGEHFAEVHESLSDKDFLMAIQGKMLVELGELDSLHGQNIKKIKGIMSTATDRYRTPYARAAEDVPRTSVFAGTTNEDDWNVDDTGARRFWPVQCSKIDLDWLRANREQCFAEAVARYKAGGTWWEIPLEESKARQAARRPSDPWDELIGNYCAPFEYVTIAQIACNAIKLEAAQTDMRVAKRIASILRFLGYSKTVAKHDDRKSYKAWKKFAG